VSICKNFLSIIVLLLCNLIIANAADSHDCEQCRESVGSSLHGSTGKWLDQTVPHRDWKCIEIEDLGSQSKKCEMCEVEMLRYLHRMKHNNYKNLEVGCICAGHMEGDVDSAKNREKQIKSRDRKRDKWLSRKWETSAKGNPYFITRKSTYSQEKHHVIITNNKQGKYSASVDKTYLGEWYDTENEAKLAAFDKIWPAKIVMPPEVGDLKIKG